MKRVLLLVTLALMLACAMALSGAAHADTTFTVNTTGDENDRDFPGGSFDGSSVGRCDVDRAASGRQCTLRAAIQEANVTTGEDTINFNIPDDPTNPDDDVKTISPSSALPTITDTVTIDGYTQAGSHPNTLDEGNDAVLNIELSGSNLAEPADGLVLDNFGGDASNSMIRGLVINSFEQNRGIKAYSNNVEIEGNFLGTDPSGTDEESNLIGVGVGGTDNTIGGTTPEARNLISGNADVGVFLEPQSEGNSVWGNYIGTQRDGTKPLGNSAGVLIRDSNDNTIGGNKAEKANRIAFNSVGVAIDVNNLLAEGNRVLRNSIFSNGGLGIDLDGVGPTQNDNKDRDEGPNTLQNKPNLALATTTGTRITIQGTLRSTPDASFTVRFFANRSEEPRGYEGRTYLGTKSVSTDANGEATFTKALSTHVRAGQRITATATGPGGNTSEFSAPQRVLQQ